MSVCGMRKCPWGIERVCTVWGVWGASVRAEGKYIGHGVSVHREKGVHSVGYVGGMRSGDERAHRVGRAQDTGAAQGCQGTCMGAGGAWHKLEVCRRVSLPV